MKISNNEANNMDVTKRLDKHSVTERVAPLEDEKIIETLYLKTVETESIINHILQITLKEIVCKEIGDVAIQTDYHLRQALARRSIALDIPRRRPDIPRHRPAHPAACPAHPAALQSARGPVGCHWSRRCLWLPGAPPRFR